MRKPHDANGPVGSGNGGKKARGPRARLRIPRLAAFVVAATLLACARESGPVRVRRIAERLPPASLAIPEAHATEAFAIEFDRPEDLARVVAHRGIGEPSLGKDGLLFRTVEHRSWIDLRLDVDASEAGILVVRMRRSEGHIRPFAGWVASPAPGTERPGGVARVKMRILEREDPYLVLWIPAEDDPRWNGRIERIRIYPTNLPDCEVEIDRIALVRAPLLARWRDFEKQTSVRGKVTIAQEMRDAILAPPPRRLEAEVALPEGARLDLGFALLEPGWRVEGAATSFRVLVREGRGAETPVFEATIDPERRIGDRRWHDATVDLSAYGGRRAVLVLETRATEEGTSPLPAPAVWSDPVLFRPGLDPGERNVVLVSLDTLRADRLGAYGYPVATSPNLDRFAREGFFFEEAVSQAASTGPSHMSLFLSLYPTVHGIVNHDARLPDEAVTMAEILRDAGFATGAFTEGGYIAGAIGFHQGFASYAEVGGQGEDRGGYVDETFARGIDWLERHRDRRFFLFLQTYEPHVPYCPGPPYDGMYFPEYEGPLDACISYNETKEINYGSIGANPDLRENHASHPATPEDLRHVEALYDGEIRKTDAAFDDLLAAITRLGLERDTIVLAFSDHGEDFGDHLAVARHGRSLYVEMLHVPMILRIPGFPAPARRIAEPIPLVDVLPTLLELLGVDLPALPHPIAGRSLLPLLRDDGTGAPRELFAENYSMANRAMIREGPYKLIETREFTREDVDRLDPESIRIRGLRLGAELYEIRSDPGERRDLFETNPEMGRKLREKLRAFLAEQEARKFRRETGELDEAERKRLEDLGYIEEGNDGG